MATRRKNIPDLFADTSLDPVESATGYENPSPSPKGRWKMMRAIMMR